MAVFIQYLETISSVVSITCLEIKTTILNVTFEWRQIIHSK